MSDPRRMLELAGDRFEMPEPAMDRLLRRQERRQRNERIAAAVVGLGVAAAGIVGAVVTLRVTEGGQPAPEGQAVPASADAGGFVLPTVAIWTAIVVLGLTVLAAMRLRARFTDMDVEQEGRGPGGAAASARRPAAVPDTAPRGGGTQMDSKPNTRTGIPQAEMPEIRFDDGKLRRTNRWLVGAVVVLALALVAVGTWAIVDRSGGEETAAPAPTQPPMPSATAELMDGFSAAVNEGNAAGAAALFTEEGVLRLADGTVVEGRQEIEEFLDGVSGVEFQQIGDLVIYGNLVTGIYEYRLTDGSPGSAQALARSMVIRNGQILSVTDAATPPPDESA